MSSNPEPGVRVALMVNPLSGRGQGAVTGANAATRLQALGHRVTRYDRADMAWCITSVGAALAQRADRPDALVVVGGDGAVNLAVNLLAGSRMPLGVIPAGTGNDIARSIGLPLDPVAAVDTIDACLRSGTTRDVDIVGISGAGRPAEATDLNRTRLIFAGVMATGFDAAVSERANLWTWPKGPARYNVAIARELPLYRPRSYRLELDGELWEPDALLVSIANAASYGGGMRIAPDASMADGLLDVVVVHPISKSRFIRLFPKVYKGTHTDLPDVEVRQAKRLSICTTDSRPAVIAYADGERIGPLPLTVEVQPGAVSMLARP